MPLLRVDLGGVDLNSAAGSVVICAIVFAGIIVGGYGVSRAQKAGWRTGAGDVVAVAILAGSLTAAGFVVAHAVNALDSTAKPRTTVPNASTSVSVQASTGSSTPQRVLSVSSGVTASTSGGTTSGTSSASTATRVTGGAETIGPAGDPASLVRLLMVFVIGFALIGILLLYRRIPNVEPGGRSVLEYAREEMANGLKSVRMSRTSARSANDHLAEHPRAAGHVEDARREASAAVTIFHSSARAAKAAHRPAAEQYAVAAEDAAKRAIKTADELVELLQGTTVLAADVNPRAERLLRHLADSEKSAEQAVDALVE